MNNVAALAETRNTPTSAVNLPDIKVEAGEVCVLVGPSGSGKTTLLNLIGGLDHADEGEVTVAGERLDRLSGGEMSKWRSHHVGFVFQFYNLVPNLTARAGG